MVKVATLIADLSVFANMVQLGWQLPRQLLKKIFFTF